MLPTLMLAACFPHPAYDYPSPYMGRGSLSVYSPPFQGEGVGM